MLLCYPRRTGHKIQLCLLDDLRIHRASPWCIAIYRSKKGAFMVSKIGKIIRHHTDSVICGKIAIPQAPCPRYSRQPGTFRNVNRRLTTLSHVYNSGCGLGCSGNSRFVRAFANLHFRSSALERGSSRLGRIFLLEHLLSLA